MQRKAYFFLLLIASQQMLGLSLRPFCPNGGNDAPLLDQIQQPPLAAIDPKQKGVEGGGYGNKEAGRGLRSNLGSRPPTCEHKCGGCIPCNAIQTPTTTDHLGLQYANYEPEGWKCKCGASFFNP